MTYLIVETHHTYIVNATLTSQHLNGLCFFFIIYMYCVTYAILLDCAVEMNNVRIINNNGNEMLCFTTVADIE